ncbi:MAG: flagellar export chaperone FlgN [Planctomycetes bacterium]|nr:flagellar export chaperone FlgN [Planctomycetota bacterium]
MPAQFSGEIRRFLHDLDNIQSAFEELFGRKRELLTAAEAARLVTLADEEASLVERMQRLITRRGRLLIEARTAGSKADSLTGLAAELPEDERESLRPELSEARRRTEALRRESWLQWIVASRTFRHYSDLLELMAHGGREPATYDGDRPGAPAGGALLDAAI